MKKNAFTLLEILVVISIIGILIALGTAAYTTAQRKGRDAKRQADIKAIQNGFEQYNAKEGSYPVSEVAAGDTTIFPSGLPSDPKDSGTYTYSFELSADAYCVCALLESDHGNATALSGSTTCTYGSGGDYFCLSNLQ